MHNINLNFLQNPAYENEQISELWQLFGSKSDEGKKTFEHSIVGYLEAVKNYNPSSDEDVLELTQKINNFLIKIVHAKNSASFKGNSFKSIYDFILRTIEHRLLQSYVKTENVNILSVMQNVSNFSFKDKDDYYGEKEPVFLNYCYRQKKTNLLTRGYLNELFSIDNYHQWLLCVNSKEIFNATISGNQIGINHTKIKEFLYIYLPSMELDFALHVCKKFNIGLIDYTLQLKKEKPKYYQTLINSLIEENKVKTLKYFYKHKVFSFLDNPQGYLDYSLYALILKNTIKSKDVSDIEEMTDFMAEQIPLSNKKYNKNYEIARTYVQQKATVCFENTLLFFIHAFVRVIQNQQLNPSFEGQYVDMCVDKLVELDIPYFTCAKILDYIFEQENNNLSINVSESFSSRYEKIALDKKIAKEENITGQPDFKATINKI